MCVYQAGVSALGNVGIEEASKRHVASGNLDSYV